MRLLTAVFLSLIIAGCGGQNPEQTETRRNEEKPVDVRTAVLEKRSIPDYFTLPGTVEAWESATVSVDLAGTVIKTYAEEGEKLTKGSSVISLDTSTYKAAADNSRATLALAEKEYARAKLLYESDAVSKQTYDQALAALEQADADLRYSEAQLGKAVLKSPITGWLDRRYIDTGEYVAPGDPVAVIVNTDRMRLIVDVPEKDVRFLKEGTEVELFEAQVNKDGAEYKGKVLHVAKQAEAATKTYRVKLEITGGKEKLRPGMIIRARFLRREFADVFVIPVFSVVDKQEGKVVFVEKDGRAVQIPVAVSAVVGENAVIENGLNAGDRLIIKGQQFVADGSKVQAE
ncbi:efflux RND transporter periplasmic adaptor subunit [Geovibrio thiophilus]|uniref:Efflux RND transporter periplasmic adaptor subunit n=1 Tax=Geovibrio thiophilus TaxID=139438 RepID=A0A3R5UTE9_9BACT|nr:efflux RND transporter periplasmic adaptor subunit [Geovibrio thiophilus]QAR32013.1 efflux RND transporter periplasmic adaptor subunit [Geovibrio thiophilus]